MLWQALRDVHKELETRRRPRLDMPVLPDVCLPPPINGLLPICDFGSETLSDDDKGRESSNLAANPDPEDLNAGIDLEMDGVFCGDAFASGSNVDECVSASIVLPPDVDDERFLVLEHGW